MGQNKFCRHISNSLYLQPRNDKRLTAAPCCWFLKNETVVMTTEDVQHYQQQVKQITDYSGGQCDNCLLREQYGFRKSIRQKGFEIFNESDGEDLINLEVQIDNRCNAACIMCSEQFSTQWKTLNNKLKGISITSKFNPSSFYVENIIKGLDLSKLRYLQFVGGEPFYTSTHLDVLKLVPHPENVFLRYTTNNSIFPTDEIFQEWKKFKKIGICVSLDDVADRFEYIRWPLQWHQVDSNIKKYLSLKDQNISVTINCTLNPLSIWYHNELVEYLSNLFEVEDPYESGILFIDYTKWSKVDLDRCPDDLRESVYQKFGPDHRVSKMLSGMNQDMYEPMTQWLATQEKLRGCKPWQEVFPEMTAYFK